MNYIDRYNQLEKNSKTIIIGQNPKLVDKPMLIYNGFIGSNAIVKPYSDTNGFKLDDTGLYKDFINKYGNSKKDFNMDISLIQQFLDEYFVGREQGVNEVRKENKSIHSINKYKSHGGMCIHFSTVANNLLQILGYDCNMILTNIGSENHAFIIIKNEGKNYIYDPTNRSKCFIESENKFKSFYKIPTLVEKSNEEIIDFYNNKSDLTISDNDESIKNSKQKGGIKISLPRLNYSCRNKTSYISLSESKVLADYKDNLRSKGLSEEKIEEIIRRIQSDVRNNVTPKVDTLKSVYDEVREEINKGM